jgi:thermostable 8-oxoguanine DNA glycosylase
VTEEVRRVFKTLKTNNRAAEYQAYLNSIAPRSAQEVFWRFVFAYMSIHTTFRGNVLGYLALRDNESAWESRDALERCIRDSKAGMYKVRADYLWEFHKQFFNNAPLSLTMVDGVRELRNQLYRNLKGIGIAKTSFALEMSLPAQAEVVCFDVHQLRLYGQPEKVDSELYQKLEVDWIIRSLEIGYTPYAARCHYWDMLKEKPSPRFWAYVFEALRIDFQDAQSLSFEPTRIQELTLNQLKI